MSDSSIVGTAVALLNSTMLLHLYLSWQQITWSIIVFAGGISGGLLPCRATSCSRRASQPAAEADQHSNLSTADLPPTQQDLPACLRISFYAHDTTRQVCDLATIDVHTDSQQLRVGHKFPCALPACGTQHCVHEMLLICNNCMPCCIDACRCMPTTIAATSTRRCASASSTTQER
jgi:hypothetical protein